MPNRGQLRGSPRAQLAEGLFPHGPLPADTPTPVVWAAEIACRLQLALEGVALARVAHDAGVGRQTLYDILNGSTWPDLVTIVRLQECLNTSLLPTWTPQEEPASPTLRLVQ